MSRIIRLVRLAALAAATALASASAALGQDAPYRVRLAALLAELDTCSTPASVDAIARSRPPVKSDGVGNLEEGFITLRRGVLLDDERLLVEAWGDLERVADVRPSWPFAQLGVAMAAMELYSRHYVAPARYKGASGGTHYEGFIYEMREMLKREPGFREGLAWLADALDKDGDRNQPASLMRLLSFAVDSFNAPAPPATLLVLARHARTERDWDGALSYLDRFMAAGGDSGVAFLERARTLAGQGSLTAAVEHYESGLHIGTREGLLFYLGDLEWVATDAEMRYIESLPFDQQPQGIQRFWQKRDDRDLRDYGSRITEHLRRWAYVHKAFRVDFPERRTVFQDVFTSIATEKCLKDGPLSLDDYTFRDPSRAGRYRKVEFILDHRAIIYMRHGEPIMRLGGAFSGEQGGYTAESVEAIGAATEAVSDPWGITPFRLDRTTTWVYLLKGEVRVFSFYGHDAMGTHRATTLFLHRPPITDVLLQLMTVSPTYARMAGLAQFAQMNATASALPNQCMPAYQQVVQEQRDGTAIAVSTDTYLRRFDQPVKAAMQVFAMGQPHNGSGQLVAALAVETAGLVEDSTSDTLTARYRVQIEIAAIDSLTGRSVRTSRWRTVERARSDSATWRQWIIALPLEPGLSEVRVGVFQGSARGGVYAGIATPAGRAAPLAMSDLMLGAPGGPAWRNRAGIDVSVRAFVNYRRGDVLSIYHEVYGTQAGEWYETRLTVYALDRSEVATALTYSDVANGPTLVSRRLLDLSELKPGDYRLRIEVVGRPGTASVWRERPLTVEKP